jgi:ribosomal protein L40E
MPRFVATRDCDQHRIIGGRVTPLLVGTALAVASLCFVLYPLFRADISGVQRKIQAAPARQSPAVDALRELEFDRQTGKISDADYEPLKARYTAQALAVMRAGNSPVCEKCGPRPELDAEFCSKCGAPLIS